MLPRPTAVAALARRALRRQPWRLLEVEDEGPSPRAHLLLNLLAQGPAELEGAAEEALALFLSPSTLVEAGRQREAQLAAARSSTCRHQTVCACGAPCGRVEAFPGQFSACGGCSTALYCSRECRTQHWLAGHQATCPGAAAAAAAAAARGEGVDAPMSLSSLRPVPPEPAAPEVSGGPCPDCVSERRQTLQPIVAGIASLGGDWNNWRSLIVWPRQPRAVRAMGAAASELLAAAAHEHREQPLGLPCGMLVAWSEFRARAVRDVHSLFAQLRSFGDALVTGVVPLQVLRRAESWVEQELGGDRSAWPAAAKKATPVGARAAELLAGWLAAVFRVADMAPPLPCLRLRTVANYRHIDPEAAVRALCSGREASPALVRTLGRLASFVDVPRLALLRHVDFGGRADVVAYLARQPWLPRSGLDSTALVQLCGMPGADADLIRDLASRTQPDSAGFRALWRLAGGWSARGQTARQVTTEWAEHLPHQEVVTALRGTALQVSSPSTEEDLAPEAEAEELGALREALTMPWLEGLRVRGETVRNIYCNRLLTAESVDVARFAARGLSAEDAESLLADVEPCLMRHDSRGTVALLDWLGRGKPKPVFARLLHGLLRTGGSRHPPEHTRASVEAVECLLSACPRLAQASLHLEQLGLCGSWLAGGSESPTPSGSGRLLPLQTLCLSCETATAHSVALARALLRRAPDGCSRPLPRVLRRNARGSGFTVFVGDSTAMILHRCLAAEEAGRDSSCLRELLKVLQDQVDASAKVDACAKSGSSPCGSPACTPTGLPEPPSAPLSLSSPRPPATPPSARSSRPRPRAGLQASANRSGPTAPTSLASRSPATLCHLLTARSSSLPPLGSGVGPSEAASATATVSFAVGGAASPGEIATGAAPEREIGGIQVWRCAASRCPVVAAALPAIGAR